MRRILGLTVAIVVPLTLATGSHAQSTFYGAETTGAVYGAPPVAVEPYGGFGFQYSPAVPADGVVMDQYGLLHPVPYAGSAPELAAQPRPRMMTRYGSRRAIAQPRYQLPTGSLGWSAGNGGMLNPVEARRSAYGSGYGVGPYGVVDHRMMWKW